MSGHTPQFDVEVRCALRHRQAVVRVRVSAGDTVSDALGRSAILERFPELDAASLSFAIHGARVDAGTRLNPGDRVDLLRPLDADPRETRRRRARKAAAARDAAITRPGPSRKAAPPRP